MDSRTTRLLIVAAAGVAAFVAILLAAYHLGPIERWDAQALDGLSGVASDPDPLVSQALRVVHLGNPWVGAAILAAICAAGLALGRRREVLAAATIFGVSAIAAQVLQIALAHPRYTSTGGTGLPDTSYPSGHATMAMAVALAAVLAAPSRWRPVAAVCGATFALLVAVGLVADAWHYPSDVLGGFLVATTTTLIVIAVLGVGEGRERAAPDRGRVPRGLRVRSMGRQAFALLAGAAGAAVVLVALTQPGELTSLSALHAKALLATIGLSLVAVGLVYAMAAELETR